MRGLGSGILRWQLLLWLVGSCFSWSVLAVIDVVEFENELERQRYFSFIEELRCPKCQNQNLAGSDSPIAADLRRELRRLLDEGKSDKEIVDFMVNRYGEYVLYRPRVGSTTAVLWGLPIFLLVSGVLAIAFTVRQRRKSALQSGPEEVSEPDRQRLEELLKEAEKRDTP